MKYKMSMNERIGMSGRAITIGPTRQLFLQFRGITDHTLGRISLTHYNYDITLGFSTLTFSNTNFFSKLFLFLYVYACTEVRLLGSTCRS